MVSSLRFKPAQKNSEAHYDRKIFTTGGPVVGKGGYINDYQTSASVGAELLKEDRYSGRTGSNGSFTRHWP